MKMLHVTAETLPLYVGKSVAAKAPPLCGCVPADSSYIAKVRYLFSAFFSASFIKVRMSNTRRWEIWWPRL